MQNIRLLDDINVATACGSPSKVKYDIKLMLF